MLGVGNSQVAAEKDPPGASQEGEDAGYVPQMAKGKDKGGKGKPPSPGKGKGKDPPAALPALTAEQKQFRHRFGMSDQTAMQKGSYSLSAHVSSRDAASSPLGLDFVRKGTYEFDQSTGVVTATPVQGSVDSQVEIGRFSAVPTRDEIIPEDVFESCAEASIPCIEVVVSEIMLEMHKLENSGAYFVLPSQMNGAEYPSHAAVVTKIDEYKFDNTGGPRAQLAVHPAAGQFMLDNAANSQKELGINAIDEVLQQTNTALCQAGLTGKKSLFQLMNGYLRMPSPEDQKTADMTCKIFRSQLHRLRPLAMHGVPACGLKPNKGEFSSSGHVVSLVYASAVPVNAYVNGIGTVSKSFSDEDQRLFQSRIAESILISQYYAAMKLAAEQSSVHMKTKIFLMPLGGGVFKNSLESIVRAMAVATEMLEGAERDALEIKVLAFERARTARSDEAPQSERIAELLSKHRKLKQ